MAVMAYCGRIPIAVGMALGCTGGSVGITAVGDGGIGVAVGGIGVALGGMGVKVGGGGRVRVGRLLFPGWKGVGVAAAGAVTRIYAVGLGSTCTMAGAQAGRINMMMSSRSGMDLMRSFMWVISG